MVKKVEDAANVGRVYPNGKSGKNKCSGGQKSPVRTRKGKKRNKKRYVCNKCG